MSSDQRRFTIGSKRSSVYSAPTIIDGIGALSCVRVVIVRQDAMVSAAEVERLIPTVSRHLVYVWRAQGKLSPAGRRGRSPLYRWCDVVAVERDTRLSDPAHQRADAMVA